MINNYQRYRLLDEEEAAEFTDVYWIRFQDIPAARIAKRKCDDYNFIGNLLGILSSFSTCSFLSLFLVMVWLGGWIELLEYLMWMAWLWKNRMIKLIIKRINDTFSNPFLLDVAYAPQFESAQDMKAKLDERRRIVARKIAQSNSFF